MVILRIASILTGLLLLVGQVYNSAVYGYYQWKFDYFANVLCENQDRPELHCDGQCQLAEMLAPADQTPQPEQLPIFVPAPDLFYQIEGVLADFTPGAANKYFPLVPHGLIQALREVPTPPPRRFV